MRRLFIALFSLQQKNFIKRTLYLIKIQFSRLFGWSPLLSTLFYTLISSAFRREQFAILQGRLAYQRQLSAGRDSSILLRRNIHRLEKGLIMRPRRAVFAEDYITETVAEYVAVYQSIEYSELKWATSVLVEYFAVVAPTTLIDKARAQFMSVHQSTDQQLMSAELPQSVPYCYAQLAPQRLQFDDLFRLMQRRRSVRWFLPDAVPQPLLEQAVQAAALAPSACNRQPFQFIQLEGADAATVAGFAMGTTGFAQQIPTLLVVLGDLSAYPAERDRHVIYIDGALVSMQLMLALDTLGLASCPINWPDVEVLERKMDAYLKLQPWQRPVMLIAIGYADPTGGIAYSAKKTVGQLLVPFRSRSVDNSAHKSADKKESSC